MLRGRDVGVLTDKIFGNFALDAERHLWVKVDSSKGLVIALVVDNGGSNLKPLIPNTPTILAGYRLSMSRMGRTNGGRGIAGNGSCRGIGQGRRRQF
jgi:hypothetical protein